MLLKDVRPKEKLTPKMVKGMASADEQDYAVLYYFTQNDFESYEDCVSHWEDEDIEVFAKALQKVMKAMQPKLDKFAALNNEIAD